MEQLQKSLKALERALAKLGADGLQDLIEEVNSLDIIGPTIDQYFNGFENEYTELFACYLGEKDSTQVSVNLLSAAEGPPLSWMPLLKTIKTTDENSVVSFLYLWYGKIKGQICVQGLCYN